MIRQYLQRALEKATCQKHPVAAVLEIYRGSNMTTTHLLGWNGPPSAYPHDACLRAGYPSGESMEFCSGVHAERRLISRAARDGIKTRNATLYISECFPCADCAKSIVVAGITKLVTPDQIYSDPQEFTLTELLQNQSYNFELAEKILREARLELVVDPSIHPYPCLQ